MRDKNNHSHIVFQTDAQYGLVNNVCVASKLENTFFQV